MLDVVKETFGNQRKICDIFFVFSPPCGRAAAAGVRLQRNPAQVPFVLDAALKSIVTDAENCSKYTIAGRNRAFSCQPQSSSVTLRTVIHGQRQRIRPSPIHIVLYPLVVPPRRWLYRNS